MAAVGRCEAGQIIKKPDMKKYMRVRGEDIMDTFYKSRQSFYKSCQSFRVMNINRTVSNQSLYSSDPQTLSCRGPPSRYVFGIGQLGQTPRQRAGRIKWLK